ncbi:MAG: hypothetical protein ACO2ZD_00620 [Pseudomonadales bacterium]
MNKHTEDPDFPARSLESDIFENLGQMISVKDEVVRDCVCRFEITETVRNFTNQMPTLSEDEKRCKNRSEATNFGSTFRAAQVNIAPLESMVLGTDSLVQVIFDTNNPARDAILSKEVSNLINDGIFNKTDRFDMLWRAVAGESYISGGVALVFDDESSGLFPRFARHLFFPRNTPLYADGITCAFEKREMSLSDLEKLASRDDDYFDTEAIDNLIQGIKSNLRQTGTDAKIGSTDSHLTVDSVRSTRSAIDATLDVWYYYEVRHEDEDQYVSQIVFIDGVNASYHSGSTQRAVIAQDKRAFSSPEDWLHFVVMDEEIGGFRTTDTLRGLAEAGYPAAVLIEELFNLQLEGALMTAKPTLVYNDTVDPDEALQFRLGEDLFAPQGVTDFLQIPNQTSQMHPLVSWLTQTHANINSMDRANNARGQELRQQAVERQANSSVLQTNRLTKAYKTLDRILTAIVGRLITLDPPAGTDDYRTFRWFRECLNKTIVRVYKLEDENGDDYEYSKKAMSKADDIRKGLAERKYGRFKHWRVRANRIATGFDRVSEEENAQFLLDLLQTGLVPSQLVPPVIKTAIALRTENPDLAEMVTTDPEPIATDQAQIATFEWSAILRRGLIGEVYPLRPDDIHIDHVAAHLTDLVSHLQRHAVETWGELEVAEFYGAAEHLQLHFGELQKSMSDKDLAGQYYVNFQEIVGAATKLIQEIMAAQETEQQGDDPDTELKRAKAQQIMVQTELAIAKHGLDQLKEAQTNQQRMRREEDSERRMNLLERQQQFKESLEARKLQLTALKMGKPVS